MINRVMHGRALEIAELCEEFALHASVQLLQISGLCYQRSAAFPTKTMRSTSESAKTQIMIGHAFERGYTPGPARSRYQGVALRHSVGTRRRMEGLKYCGGLNWFRMYEGVDRTADHYVTVAASHRKPRKRKGKTKDLTSWVVWCHGL
jgi:hypothetical protein